MRSMQAHDGSLLGIATAEESGGAELSRLVIVTDGGKNEHCHNRNDNRADYRCYRCRPGFLLGKNTVLLAGEKQVDGLLYGAFHVRC